MITTAQHQALVAITERFKITGDELNLAALQDEVDKTIHDKEGEEWKEWTAYMSSVNQVWCDIHKEGKQNEYPKPPADANKIPEDLPHESHENSSTPFQDSEACHAERLQRKLVLEGGGDVGPARTQTGKNGRSKGGKPADELINELIIQRSEPSEHDSAKMMPVVYCIGCDRRAVGRDAARIRSHASKCDTLRTHWPKLYAHAQDALQSRSHSEKLGDNAKAPTVPLRRRNGKAPEHLDSEGSGDSTLKMYMNPAKLSSEQQLKAELMMFRCFIGCGLPWNVADNKFYREFIYSIAPNFIVPERSSFFDKMLSQEVVAWNGQMQKFLSEIEHQTLSKDGWSTLMHEEVYTFHLTTPKRRSFFIHGEVFKGQSINTEVMFGIIQQLLSLTPAGSYLFDPHLISAIAGDGGPQVRGARNRVRATWPWILAIWDPSHNLNLYMKDIGKLFKELLSQIAGVANYFGKSNYGTWHLNDEREKQKIGKGIESTTDTRFSSAYYQALSVQHCMPAISTCYSDGRLSFNTTATKKLKPYIDSESDEHNEFVRNLSKFLHLLEPGANAIKTLEGSTVTCADVFYCWVAIAYQQEQVFASKSSIQRFRSDVLKAYNRRFDQMMSESSHKIFLVGYFLHPLFRKYGGLHLNMLPLGVNEALPKEKYPPLFRQILLELLAIFQGEQLRRNEGGSEQVPKFISQVIDYAYGRAPFTVDPSKNIRSLDPLKYWKKLRQDSGAMFVSNVGIKVFSISPSEICDEREASRLGWLDSARRASITPENLINSAKMYECYAFGLDEKPSAHRARVHLSPITSSESNSAPAIHSAPTLHDLLNSENVEPSSVDKAALEETWFNHPDPYDVAEVERVNETLQDTSVRVLDRFAIADYVQLLDPSLIKLLTNASLDEPVVGLEASDVVMQVPGTQPGYWNADAYL